MTKNSNPLSGHVATPGPLEPLGRASLLPRGRKRRYGAAFGPKCHLSPLFPALPGRDPLPYRLSGMGLHA